MKHKNVALEIKKASDDGSTGEGIANAFNNIDSYREIVVPGAFSADLARFLEEGFVGGLNHDWEEPIGRPTKAVETAIGLEVGWQISDTTHGRDVKVLLKDKVIRKLSIGYRVKSDEYLQTAEDVAAYWKEQGYTPSSQDVARAANGGIRLLRRIELYEFSPVTVPANDLADITGVKGIQTERDFERFLRDSGYSRSEAVKITAKGWKASQRDSGDEDEPNGKGDPLPISTSTEALRLKTEFLRITSRLRTEGLLK